MIYILICLVSLVDGIKAGFEFDGRKSFEHKFDVDPFGFWGSLSWTRMYDHPNFYNKTFGVFDFYHVSDDVVKYGYLLSGFLMCFINWKMILIVIILSIVFKIIGMAWIRKQKRDENT